MPANWSPERADVKIRYTNLPAYMFDKEFRFEVMARNSDGVWFWMDASPGGQTSDYQGYVGNGNPATNEGWSQVLTAAASTFAAPGAALLIEICCAADI